MTGGMLELSEDESGEELLPEESDYRAIPELDRYDADMLDDRPRAQSSRRELSARQRAEEVMSARDAQQRRGIAGRGGEHGAHAGGNAASGRGPRALEQVKANRTSNLELARLGAALARLRPPALSWLAGRLPPPVVTPAPPPLPAFCWGCALLGSLSAA